MYQRSLVSIHKIYKNFSFSNFDEFVIIHLPALSLGLCGFTMKTNQDTLLRMDESIGKWENYWSSPLKKVLLTHLRKIFNFILVKRLSKTLCMNTVILEVGCGTATSLSQIKHKHPHLNCIGLDFSDTALKVAKPLAKKHGIHLIKADGKHIPIKAKTLQLAYAQGLIEHLNPFDESLLLSEIAKISEVAAFTVPKRGGVLDFLHTLFSAFSIPWLFPNERYYTKQNLNDTLSAHFNNVRVKPFLMMDFIAICKDQKMTESQTIPM